MDSLVKVVTGEITLDHFDTVVICNPSGNINIYLPSKFPLIPSYLPNSNNNPQGIVIVNYSIKNDSTHRINIQPLGGVTIDGLSNIILENEGDSADIIYDSCTQKYYTKDCCSNPSGTVNPSGSPFITSVSDTATIDLTVLGGNLSADLVSIAGLGTALTKTDDTNVTLTLGGSPTTALVNAASLTLGWTGTLGVARGGTNIASYTNGDILYASGATTLSKLGIGTPLQILRTNAGATAPEWYSLVNPSGTVTSITAGVGLTGGTITQTGTISLDVPVITTYGGTGITGYSQGDTLYYNSGTLFSVLHKNTTATRYLSNQGTSNNPSWNQVDLSNGVTNVLPSTNGGEDTLVDYSATSTIVGWSSFTTKYIAYIKTYNSLEVFFVIQGASNNATTTFTIPYNASSTIPAFSLTDICRVQNVSGSFVPGVWQATASSNVITFYATAAGGAFGNSSTKAVSGSIVIPL